MHAHAKESKIFSTLSLGAKISKYIFFIKKSICHNVIHKCTENQIIFLLNPHLLYNFIKWENQNQLLEKSNN